MLEILVVFTVPWLAFLWAVHKFFDDHILGTNIALAGALTAEAGLLAVGMDVERFQAKCTIQSMVHNMTLPCKMVPGAYEILVPVNPFNGIESSHLGVTCFQGQFPR